MIKIDENDPVGELEPSFPFRNVVVKKNTDVKKFYDLQKEIGRGKFGTVFKCRERSTGLKLAAKFISIAQRQDRRNAEREVEIMRELQHPRLIQIYDAYELNNIMCVVLELIEGGELFERVIDDDFILTEKSVSVFMRQICEGVAFIHSKNILHLDMKPENILCLTREGNRIKIIDFGLARKYDPEKKLQVLFGTPEFVAPEVVNFDSIGFGTDMWSVGVICYVLLSGLSPFMGETDVATMANVTIAQYDFDDEAFNDISKDAQDFISRLLLKDKEDRMSAIDCLSHQWLKRAPPAPAIKINGIENQITNELDLQKDVLRGIVDRWNRDINGNADGDSKILEFQAAENTIATEEDQNVAATKEETAVTKKNTKKKKTLLNDNGPPARKKEGDKIKLITKGVVTGLVSGFEPKKVPGKPVEKCKINGDIKKVNGFGDTYKNKVGQNMQLVKQTEEPFPSIINESNKEVSDFKLPMQQKANLPNVSNQEQEKSGLIEKSADMESLVNATDTAKQKSKSLVKVKNLVKDERGPKTKIPSNTKESNNKLPNIIINGTHCRTNHAPLTEASQNTETTLGSQNSADEKTKVSDDSMNLTAASKTQLTSTESSLTKVPGKMNKLVANEKTDDRVESNQKTNNSNYITTQATSENKPQPKSSPTVQKKNVTAKNTSDERKSSVAISSSSNVPHSIDDVKISQLSSNSDTEQSVAVAKSMSPAKTPSHNTLSPCSPLPKKKSQTPKSSPTSSRTSPAKSDAAFTDTPTPRNKKISIQVEEDDDSIQCIRKRNFLIQNIIENYEQKVQKTHSDSKRSPKINIDELLDSNQLVDIFNSPKLTQRRISDISSLLSGSDNVERSIEEMKAFCKNLSQMVRVRQDSVSDGDAKGCSKRPKFRISCFSRDVPLLNHAAPCNSNIFNHVSWFDKELPTSWNFAKSNIHSDPGSLRSSPEPLTPPSLTRKILSKFFNNSIEYGMTGIPSSPHAAPKDKITEILS